MSSVPVFFSIACLIVSLVLLLSLGRRVCRGHWLFSLVYQTAIGAGAVGLVRLLSPGADLRGPLIAFFILAVAVTAATDHWNAPGQTAFAATLFAAGSFLAYAGYVTFAARLGPFSLLFSGLLLIFQSAAMLLMVMHTFEVVDTVCRIQWRRVVQPAAVPGYFPMVSLHVPTHNEPPDLVIETLEALAKLDYPDYEVIVIDNNTTDENLWRPVERRCRELGFKFFHLENWPGFKSGALNYGLRHTDPRAEIIGVVDSDYLVAPEYLRDLVGFFRDPKIAFVQTPQDYRDFSSRDGYAHACYLAYRYFFAVSMASRNERNGIIFAGTMGLIRRRLLDEMVGWDEWCITEDAELSLRILARGYRSIYIDRSYGRGLMPFNFEGLKKQRFRWAFGGMQILRKHARTLFLPSPAEAQERLSPGQRWDYLMGGLQWLNDPVTFAFTLILLLAGASLILTRSLSLPPMESAAALTPFVFILVGPLRFVWVLRARTGCGWRPAAGAFAILLSLTWVVMLGCILGLTKREGAFLRTPKRRERSRLADAIRPVRKETLLSVLCLGCAGLLVVRSPSGFTAALLCGLLIWQALIYGSALAAGLAGYRSEARSQDPVRLRTSRTTGERFRAMISDRRGVGLAAAGALAAAFLFILAHRYATEQERIIRATGVLPTLFSDRPVREPPEIQIKARLYLEERAALRGDIGAAVALWTADGVIRDVHFTPDDPADDRVWRGAQGIRQRYEEEFAQRSYLRLSHRNLATVIDEDRGVIINDLEAVVRTREGMQRLFLAGNDRWTFRQEDGVWKIESLTLNRTPR